jgi:transposase
MAKRRASAISRRRGPSDPAMNRAQGFEVLPRRWVVERTFAWLGRCRRLAKNFEATIASAVAWTLVAHIRILTQDGSQGLEIKHNHYESDTKVSEE